MATQHDSFGNTDPQRGSRDADAMHSGDKSHLKNLSGLSDALSNDENGFSNKEGFNTDEGHERLAGSGGSQTSDMDSLDNDNDLDAEFGTDENSTEGKRFNSEFDDNDNTGANNRNPDSGNGFARGND
ncbi:MAG TPA: hypothetical protein VF676_01820 [Flavobacterium sp.]|jgi:hypothetical protein